MHALKEPLYARQRRLRRSEYERLVEVDAFRDEKVELVYGRLVEMSPQGRSHAYALMQLGELFHAALAGRARVRSQLPFVAVDESLLEPDLAVVPLGEYLDAHPDRAFLIVEVADSSLAYDRLTKGPLYAASGVAAYWIVNLVDSLIEAYTQPAGETYMVQSRHRAGESLVIPGFEASVAVADILPRPAR